MGLMPDNQDKRRLLALELWGLGDLALALPFLRAACASYEVTLLAKPHAEPLLRRFAPGVKPVYFDFPWTSFTGKYRLHSWPWRAFASCVKSLRGSRFEIVASARPDPREHALLSLLGCERRVGFPRLGSGCFLTTRLPYPSSQHRVEYWREIGKSLGIFFPTTPDPRSFSGQARAVIHTGAARAVRRWPLERWAQVAARLEQLGWRVTFLKDTGAPLEALLDALEQADVFLGNDSGPGHLAALLGVPTFTLFGPQLPSRFSPVHPWAAWLEGAACPYKPCSDYCRFPSARCMEGISVEAAIRAVETWLLRCREASEARRQA